MAVPCWLVGTLSGGLHNHHDCHNHCGCLAFACPSAERGLRCQERNEAADYDTNCGKPAPEAH